MRHRAKKKLKQTQAACLIDLAKHTDCTDGGIAIKCRNRLQPVQCLSVKIVIGLGFLCCIKRNILIMTRHLHPFLSATVFPSSASAFASACRVPP